MKRLRELSDEDDQRLNKRKMQFKYGPEHELSELEGTGLHSAILSHIEDGMRAYVRKKCRLLEEAGERGWSIDFRTTLPGKTEAEAAEYFIDLDLGLNDSLDVSEFKIKDKRFGIEVENEEFSSGEGGKIYFWKQNPDGEAEVVFRTVNSGEEERLSTDLYLPLSFGRFIDKKYWKIRCAAPFVDIILRPRQETFHINFEPFDTGEPYVLDDLAVQARLVRLIQKAHEEKDSFEFFVRAKGRQFFHGEDAANIKEEGALDDAELIVDAWRIAKRFGIEDVEVTFNDLFEQRGEIAIFANALTPRKTGASLTFNIVEDFDESLIDERMCVSWVIDINLGEYEIVASLALIGRLERNAPEECTFVSEESRVYREHMFNKGEDRPYSSRELAQAAAARCSEEESIRRHMILGAWIGPPDDNQ